MLIGFELLENGIGVYGIYLEGNLVYVGKSSNLRQRFIQHESHIKTQKSSSKMYKQLHWFYLHNYNIEIKVLEKCSIKPKILDDLETKYIQSLKPIYNQAKLKKGIPSIEETLLLFSLEERPIPVYTPSPCLAGATPSKITEKGKKTINHIRKQLPSRQLIQDLLEEKHIPYETQVSFGNCLGSLGYPIFFDFYLEQYDLFIQIIYDKCHKKMTREFFNINSKRKFCKDLECPLLEIESTDLKYIDSNWLQYEIELCAGLREEF